MLLVIVGAGASYDSVPSRLPKQLPLHHRELYRPPLADQLFEAREPFYATMRQLPQVMQIAPSLLNPSKGRSVEEILERYANEAKEYGAFAYNARRGEIAAHRISKRRSRFAPHLLSRDFVYKLLKFPVWQMRAHPAETPLNAFSDRLESLAIPLEKIDNLKVVWLFQRHALSLCKPWRSVAVSTPGYWKAVLDPMKG